MYMDPTRRGQMVGLDGSVQCCALVVPRGALRTTRPTCAGAFRSRQGVSVPGRHSRNQGGRACCPQRAANVNRHSYKLRAADRHALPPNGKIFEKWRDSPVYVSSAPVCGCKMEAARSGQTRPTTIGFRGTMGAFTRGIFSLRERAGVRGKSARHHARFAEIGCSLTRAFPFHHLT